MGNWDGHGKHGKHGMEMDGKMGRLMLRWLMDDGF
jgi:hypothetical protein